MSNVFITASLTTLPVVVIATNFAASLVPPTAAPPTFLPILYVFLNTLNALGSVLNAVNICSSDNLSTNLPIGVLFPNILLIASGAPAPAIAAECIAVDIIASLYGFSLPLSIAAAYSSLKLDIAAAVNVLIKLLA